MHVIRTAAQSENVNNKMPHQTNIFKMSTEFLSMNLWVRAMLEVCSIPRVLRLKGAIAELTC